MSTKGLKDGDTVLYTLGKNNFLATVIEVTSTAKARILPHTDVNETFNTRTRVNTYRKFMKIQPPPIKTLIKELPYSGSVWALQILCKEGGSPDTKKTVFLDVDADILVATEALKEEIIDELNCRVYDEYALFPSMPPELILKELTEFNSRSLSYYVVRIHPPPSKDYQKAFEK